MFVDLNNTVVVNNEEEEKSFAIGKEV